MVFAFAGDSTITKFFAISHFFESQKYRFFLNFNIPSIFLPTINQNISQITPIYIGVKTTKNGYLEIEKKII